MKEQDRAALIEVLLKVYDFGVDTELEDLIAVKLTKLIKGIPEV